MAKPKERTHSYGKKRETLSDADGDLVIENQENKPRDTASAPQEGVQKNKLGDGEKVFDFDMEVAFCPCVRFRIPGCKDSICFEIGPKLLIGSDPKQCKMVLDHPSVSPVHMVVGVKGDSVILKHVSPNGVKLKGKALEINKPYKIPFDEKIKIGALVIEVLRTKPLDIQSMNINRAWKSQIAAEKPAGYGEAKKKEDVGFFRSILNAIFGIFDPRDEEERQDDEDDREWVTEEEWKKAPEGDREKMKVIEAGELIDKNFKNDDKQKIKKITFFFRPLFLFFHGLKDEFSIFDMKRHKNLKGQVEAFKRKLVDMKAKHLAQNAIIPEAQAMALAQAGVSTLAYVANMESKRVAKLLKVTEEEAQIVQEKVRMGIESGTLEKSSKEVTSFEKKVQANESKVQVKRDHLQTAGPLKRIFGALGNFFSIFGAFYFLANNEQAKAIFDAQIGPHLHKAFIEYIKPNIFLLWKGPGPALAFIEVVMPFVAFHLAVQILAHLIFGLTPGQFFLGLRNSRGFLASRFLGLVRYFVGIITGPFLIFDLPILFKKKSLKELICLNTLVRRSIRNLFVEILSVIIFCITSVVGIGTFFYFLKEKNEQNLFLLPTSNLGQMMAPVLEKLNFYSKELYSINRESIIYDWHPVKVGVITGERETYTIRAFRREMAVKFETANVLHTMHWLEVHKDARVQLDIDTGRVLTLTGPLQVVVDQMTGSKEFIIYLANGVLESQSKVTGESLYVIAGDGLFDISEGRVIIASQGTNALALTFDGIHHVSRIQGMDLRVFDSIQRARGILGQMLASGKFIRPTKTGCLTLMEKGQKAPAQPVRLHPDQFSLMAKVTKIPEMYVCKSHSPTETPNPADPAPPLRAGGVIDLVKREYIPPTKNAPWDESYGVYVYDKNDITFDSESGAVQFRAAPAAAEPSLLDTSTKLDKTLRK
ncbi:MAG: FHA domain-containing protein [Bdellovibrio sp.]|nr:FHA domain-containing protein [Bdellovibrio sp.]